MTPAILADRLALLCETESLAAEILILEQCYGASPAIEDVRDRLHRVRGVVFSQLRAALVSETETRH